MEFGSPTWRRIHLALKNILGIEAILLANSNCWIHMEWPNKNIHSFKILFRSYSESSTLNSLMVKQPIGRRIRLSGRGINFQGQIEEKVCFSNTFHYILSLALVQMHIQNEPKLAFLGLLVKKILVFSFLGAMRNPEIL